LEINKFQITSALLDALVLAVVEKEDAYGYKITGDVKSVLNVSESTLYPVLRRLQKSNLLATYDKEFDGRNRRYYQLTTFGGEVLLAYRNEWQDFKMRIESVLLSYKTDEEDYPDTIPNSGSEIIDIDTGSEIIETEQILKEAGSNDKK
jgi:PadR family transcriptional regulator PadR